MKRISRIYLTSLIVLLTISITPKLGYSQVDNISDPTLGSGGAMNSGTGNGTIDPAPRNPNTDPLDPGLDPPTDPGGPVDPPDDVLPIDNGVSFLLVFALISGFLLIKRKENLSLKSTN